MYAWKKKKRDMERRQGGSGDSCVEDWDRKCMGLISSFPEPCECLDVERKGILQKEGK